ncbi:MAG: threonine ammonia-lyase [Balneolaceae bacterium]
MNHLPALHDIEAAASRISSVIHRTPIFTSRYFDEQTNGSIFFKCENFQRTGSFKFRGASNAVLSLDEKTAKKGVATHSSGNHGQAVARAAQLRGIPATIVMPAYAPDIKKRAVRGYGATIVECQNSLQSREETLQQVLEQTGATFIHPYNQIEVICGQGTCAMELLDELPDLDTIITPVGGGGLLSGTAIYTKSIKPHITVIGAEPAEADDACRSFRAGRHITDGNRETVADGLRATLGPLTFTVIHSTADAIVTVSEEAIIHAMRTVWERLNIIIEPSCAVPVAALLERAMDTEGKRIGVILTGGNLDLDRLPWQK